MSRRRRVERSAPKSMGRRTIGLPATLMRVRLERLAMPGGSCVIRLRSAESSVSETCQIGARGAGRGASGDVRGGPRSRAL